MDPVPLNILYLLFILFSVFAIPLYLLFRRGKARRSASPPPPPSPKSNAEPVIKCPSCGYEEHPTPRGRCYKCGADLTASMALRLAAGETAAAPEEQALWLTTAPSPGLPSWRELFGGACGLWRGRPLTFMTLGIFSAVLATPVFVGLLWLSLIRTLNWATSALGFPSEGSYAVLLVPLARDPRIFFFAITNAAIFLMLMFWSQLAFFYAHTGLGVGGSIVKAFRRIVPFAILTVLYWAIVFAGGLLLFFPGIYLAMVHSLSFAVFVSEDETPLGALRKSRKYIRGRFGDVFCKLMPMIFFAIIAFYAGMPFGLLSVVITGEDVFGWLGVGFPLVFFMHFLFTYVFKLYEELKHRSL